ncbi:unnamed protein product [Rotaria socialis]|uniref:PRA1 family protein n=2 Tax=Rotaria socialis TaxID=392032 RepID=A0A817PUQ2_9BILA|nr:unnamed protein product [Rotaria socialis]
MLKTADALKQIKNLSGLSETDCEKQRSLILRLNMEYLQTLQRFSTAQRIGCRLFNRINDQVPHVSEQELRPVKQIEVKTYNREPIQVPKNKTIDRDRNKQWLTKEMQTAPIRSLNDFLFDATWNIPKFFDDDRLKNRLHGNLIYYQTNYFAFVIVCLIIIAIMFPVDFLIHFGLILIVYVRRSSKSLFPTRFQFNRNLSSINHGNSSSSKSTKITSALFNIITVAIVFYNISFLNFLLIILFGILLPVLGIICHAILRNRNLASKISNQLNRIRSRNTPMSIFLEQFKFMDGFKMD